MSNAHGSWLQLIHRPHQPLPTEEVCFALGSASGWRGQQGTPVQTLGNAPPPHPHRRADAHFFRRQTRNHLLCLTPLSSHFYLERKSRPSPWAIVQGKPLSGHNRGAQSWVESSQRGGPTCLGFISFPQLEKDHHGLKFREHESKAESGFRKTHYSQVFKTQ